MSTTNRFDEERVYAYQVVVHSEEGHLARFIEEVGEGNEGISLLQIQNENSSNE